MTCICLYKLCICHLINVLTISCGPGKTAGSLASCLVLPRWAAYLAGLTWYIENAVFSSRNTLLRHHKESELMGLSAGVVVFDQGKVSPAQTPWLGIQGIIMQTNSSALLRESGAFKEVQEEETNGCSKQKYRNTTKQCHSILSLLTVSLSQKWIWLCGGFREGAQWAALCPSPTCKAMKTSVGASWLWVMSSEEAGLVLDGLAHTTPQAVLGTSGCDWRRKSIPCSQK